MGLVKYDPQHGKGEVYAAACITTSPQSQKMEDYDVIQIASDIGTYGKRQYGPHR